MSLLLFAIFWHLSSIHVAAEVTLPALLSDHAVLQRSDKTRIWGMAKPGETVQVVLSDSHSNAAEAKTTAGPDGRWNTILDLSKASNGPFTLRAEGSNKLSVADVVVGEVWLCSGQSNMQYPLGGTLGASGEMKTGNPMLRQFHVAMNPAPEPQEDCKGAWVIATPESVGGFTAVGYYFCKSLQTTLGVPVGLIHSSVGGTAIEVWTSAEGFAKDPSWNASRLARSKKYNDYISGMRAFLSALQTWSDRYHRADQPVAPAAFAGAGIAKDGWKPVNMPGTLASAGLPSSGSVWLRRTISIEKKFAGHPATIGMTRTGDYIDIYWNGVRIAQTTPAEPPVGGVYKFTVPADSVKEGENVVALRLFSAADRLGIEGPLTLTTLHVAGVPADLTGEWLAKMEAPLPPATAEILASLPKAPNQPSVNEPSFEYNGMIAPVTHSTIKGIVWYQGEANAPTAYEYGNHFPLFITDWREHFGEILPFYWVQLPNYNPSPREHSTGGWAEMRVSQSKALALPKTGQAVALDLGDERNLHPLNKKPVGDRLARIALAKDYGKPVVYSGPVYRAMKIDGNIIHVSFDHTDGGLVAKPLPAEYHPIVGQHETKPLVRNSPGSQVEGFAMCGEDQKWAWADARIDGSDVIISSASVPKPVAVRYAWADNPVCNLYNGAELPAAPFRTDEFPMVTQAAKY